MGETRIFRSRPRRDFYFGSRGIETETETFILGLVWSRPRPRLSFLVSWNRDRDRDFHFGSRGIETETETLNLGLVESRPRPRLSFWVSLKYTETKTCMLSLVRLTLRLSRLFQSHGTKDKVKSTKSKSQTNKCFNKNCKSTRVEKTSESWPRLSGVHPTCLSRILYDTF